jgi:hypothetical protein
MGVALVSDDVFVALDMVGATLLLPLQGNYFLKTFNVTEYSKALR